MKELFNTYSEMRLPCPWDYYAETGHFPATRIIELFETCDASQAIIMPIKLYRHSKSSGASTAVQFVLARA